MIGAALAWARRVTVKAIPAAVAARTWVPEKPVCGTLCGGIPNQFVAIDRPTATPTTRPSS
jgi:hypothetical protein